MRRICALARETGIPLRELARIVESKAWSMIGSLQMRTSA